MTGSYSAPEWKAIKATFKDGPLDGQRFDIPGNTQVYVAQTLDEQQPAAGDVPVLMTRHRYSRSPDVLKDGSAEFLYKGTE